MNKLRFQQLLSMRRQQLGILLLIGGAMVLLTWLTKKELWWDSWLDPIIGFGTFLFAMAVWYSEWLNEWEQRLPKRLTVRFLYKNHLVMICKEAHLAGEADIRPWGQQIGSQMCNKTELNFLPFFETIASKPKQGKNSLIFKPYYLAIYLSDLPEELKQEMKEDGLGKRYLRWVQGEGGQQVTSWEKHPNALPPLDQNEAL